MLAAETTVSVKLYFMMWPLEHKYRRPVLGFVVVIDQCVCVYMSMCCSCKAVICQSSLQDLGCNVLANCKQHPRSYIVLLRCVNVVRRLY